MEPLKAPGSDGSNAKFSQSFWAETIMDIMIFVRNFFEQNWLDPKVEGTTIAFIPKKQGAMCITDFRPISLCNVQYKIISKIMVGRLKPLLFISDDQGAFMYGRRANDNIVIALEIRGVQKIADP